MLANQSILTFLTFVLVSQFLCLLTTYRGLTPVEHSVLNVKALVGAFNQEKVGALSVIVKLRMILWNLRLKL